jgi:hypothetical protein
MVDLMHERGTIDEGPSAASALHLTAEAGDTTRMGADGQRGSSGASTRVAGGAVISLEEVRRGGEHGADEYLRSGRPKKDEQLRELERENQRLKETVAAQAHELMVLKKKMGLV